MNSEKSVNTAEKIMAFVFSLSTLDNLIAGIDLVYQKVRRSEGRKVGRSELSDISDFPSYLNLAAWCSYATVWIKIYMPTRGVILW